MSQIIDFFGNWINKPSVIEPTVPRPSGHKDTQLNKLDNLQEVVFKINSAGQWLFLNKKWCDYTHYEVADCLGKSWLSYIHPQDHDSCREYLRRISKGQPQNLSASIRIITRNNESRWMEMRAGVLPNGDTQTFVLVGTLTDISAEKSENERQLAQYRALFSLISNIPGMTYRCRNNRDWTMEFVSAGSATLTGYESEDIVNNTTAWSDIIHPEAREYVWMTIQSAVQNQQPFELTYRIVTKSGEEKWVWERGLGNYSANGELLGLEGLITDITDNKRQSLRIERDSLFDPFTGLATQHLFLNRIQHAIELGQEQPYREFSVLVAKISQHSNPGEESNATQNDEVDKEVAARLNAILLPSTTICRLGNSEFGILIERCKSAGNNTSRAVRSILSCLSAPLKLEQSTLYTKVSIGVAQYKNHTSNSDILGEANRAAVQAKELGGNRIEFADDDMNIRMAAILGTETELLKAIEKEQLKLICQPLKAAAGSNNQAHEIKIAWQHPRRGTLLAENFYQHIHDEALIHQLGKLVLRDIGELIATLPDKGQIYLHGLGECILNGELLADSIDTLSSLQNDETKATRFIIDIDDKLLNTIDQQGLQALQQLQQNNIGIAASGIRPEAPYAELLKLPGIQAIKLDLTVEPPNQTNLKAYNAMIACYHALDINVIAEGVDTPEISLAIKTSGFDYLQGREISGS